MTENKKKTLKQVGTMFLVILFAIGALIATFVLKNNGDNAEPTEPSINIEQPTEPQTKDGPVYLADGETVNSKIKADTTSVKFTNAPVPDGVETIDFSRDQDKTVLGYYNGADLTITSYNGDVIMAHEHCSNMFLDKSNVVSIDFTNVDTSNTLSVGQMFHSCHSLSELNISTWNTEKVVDMTNLFASCKSLTEIDVSHFNTANVQSMQGMFAGCEKVKSLDLSNFDTSKVHDMSIMFNWCYELTDLDISSFNTSSATNISQMFGTCKSLTSLNLSHFDTSKVADMSWLFVSCEKLETVNVSTWNTSNVTTTMNMFTECGSLTELDLSSFDMSNVQDMMHMFVNCQKLETIYAGDWPNNVNSEDMFFLCNSLVGAIPYDWQCRDAAMANTSGYFTIK